MSSVCLGPGFFFWVGAAWQLEGKGVEGGIIAAYPLPGHPLFSSKCHLYVSTPPTSKSGQS